MVVKKDHKARLQAFDSLLALKLTKQTRKQNIDSIHNQYEVPVGTLYDWYKEKCRPPGRQGNLAYKKELLYVLGALLGDGCLYKWDTTKYYVILVGDKKFTAKYSRMLSPCISQKVTPYIDRSKNIWFVRTNHFKLYSLLKKIRENPRHLKSMIQKEKAALLFLEGFFDAEGCVKIINDKARKTPKICLDITNTNKGFLEIARRVFHDRLAIEARYSIQKADPVKNKKKVYHLRIYKKMYIKTFFDNMSTVKLYPKKAILLENWLNNGRAITLPVYNSDVLVPS